MLGANRRLVPRVLRLSTAGALVALCLLPASAGAAASGGQLLTFDNYVLGTSINDQYEGQGVLFSGEGPGEDPEIRSDLANPTSPVLGGYLNFFSPIHAQFVVPDTTTQATVSGLSLDVGSIDDPYSTQVVVSTTTGPITLVAEEYGINTLSTSATNVTGFAVEAVSGEDAGYAIDNLAYTIPAPPPPPLPPPPPPSCAAYLVIDSRGSGEDNFKLSQPGEAFLEALKAKLKSLHNSGAIAQNVNSYPAAKVFGWFPSNIFNNLNGLGAFMHSDDIGAYKASEKKGEKILSAWVNAQAVGACKATKMILVGYSQGAELTGNVFEGLTPSVQSHVAAVVLFGDPQYNHDDEVADQDNRPLDGSLGMRPLFSSGHGTTVLSYCNHHDPICQWRLPKPTLIAYRLREHKQYWGNDTPRAEDAGRKVAELLTKKH